MEKNSIFKRLIRTVIVACIIVVVLSFFIFRSADISIYKIIGIEIIALWMCIFICYFTWAMRFYNIHFGQTEEVREKIEQEKGKRRNGDPYNIHDIEAELKANPYQEETFGMPKGTVRGLIAFTLLFGSLALLIVSFDPDIFSNQKTFFYDQFEFFKTAFLMMIAFYFGSRSLEYLRGKPYKPVPLSNEPSPANPVNTNVNVEPKQPDAGTTIASAIDNTHKVKVNVDGNVRDVPMIEQVKDPMSPQ